MTFRSARRIAALSALLVAGIAVLTPASPALAAGTVDAVAPDGSRLTAAADAETVLTVSGSGFQSIPAGFGGIYVMFGTVSGDSWQPSAGGESGIDYRYVNDDPESPAGFQQFIAFPGSSTEAEASGGTISPEGTWSATITIPGSALEVTDSSGAVSQLDCLVERCGIITIGAHGVVNANNESFTPVVFEAAATPEPTTPATPEPAAEPTPDDSAVPVADVDGSDPILPLVVGIAVIVVAAVGAVLVARRRARRTQA
ncbi:hypothetical protein [Herbiconiux sp. L3-i23]|uniref:hypothetical protein n=1 Tax=Herbiconiux sp. L3-i23 TaxID=2905871 RepID=UPI00204A0CF8|nr:hypothetical protein [Herbiconiux sp. L3-i23]BDI23044.1 hypothetical protein L3i23_18200 [Herbiconiux sp. L3-i23]